MAYGDYTFRSATTTFGLTARPEPLVVPIPVAPAPAWLTEALSLGGELPRPSEKARGELIVMPILLAVRELTGKSVVIHSGVRFDVDPKLGLVGESDFLICRGVVLPEPTAPAVAIVEAKKADIELGLGQCVAQMVAAQMWNDRDGQPVDAIYGCVTSGEVWQFLRLRGTDLAVDTVRYYLDNLPGILGVFRAILADPAAPKAAA